MSTEEETIEFSPITPSATSKQSSTETSPEGNPYDERGGREQKIPSVEHSEGLLSCPLEYTQFTPALSHVLVNIL